MTNQGFASLIKLKVRMKYFKKPLPRDFNGRSIASFLGHWRGHAIISQRTGARLLELITLLRIRVQKKEKMLKRNMNAKKKE